MKGSTDKVVQLEKKSLKRVLWAKDLFAVGYGDVGSSFYYALGPIALYALGATPIALAIAGFVFICTAITYAEMSTLFPESGGSATYSRHAFNDLISFIAGWGLLLDYIVTIAISAFAIPPYLQYLLNLLSIHPKREVLFHSTAAIVIILALLIVNVIGVRLSGKMSWILAVVTILSQIFLILFGALVVLNLPSIIEHLRIGVPGVDWSPDWKQFLKGTAMAMVAYTGIESIAQLSAESKKPAVTVPKAIKWTAVVLILLYFGVTVIGLSVVNPKTLGTTYLQDPVAGIVANLPYGGALFAPWFGIIAAFILLIAANAGLLGCSRLMYSMGENYQVPSFFYRLHSRFRTPYVSLGFFALLASVVIILSKGRMLFLADLYNFGAQIAFFFAHISLITLRCTKPGLHRPFRSPLNIPVGKGRSIPLTAIIGAFASLAVWIVVVVVKPEGRHLGVCWLVLGILGYLYYRKKRRLTPLGNVKIEKIKIANYQAMSLRHILVTARQLKNTEAMQTACQLAKSFGAKLTAIHIVEVPHSIPIETPLGKREEAGEYVLKQAEAIAQEYQLSIELKLIRARTIELALLEMVAGGEYDLLIVATGRQELKQHSNFAVQAEKILERAPCRVIFCKS